MEVYFHGLRNALFVSSHLERSWVSVRVSLAVALVVCCTTFAEAKDPAIETIFRCSIGSKDLVVTKSGPNYHYSYGRRGHPEIRLMGSSQKLNLFAADSVGTLDMYRWVRFVNGSHSYAVFFSGITELYGSREAAGGSGVVVFERSKEIARLRCTGGVGFTSGYYPRGLAEDPIDIYMAPAW